MSTTTIHCKAGVLRIERTYVPVAPSGDASQKYVPGYVDYFLNDRSIKPSEAVKILEQVKADS